MTNNRISIKDALGQGYNEFYHSRNFYRVVKGSRGSKKSKNTALDLTIKLMKYDWANILVVRRFSNTNKQSTYTDFKWAINNKLKVSQWFKFNESVPEITYIPTGQKILFRGLDDPLKITSISVAHGVLSWAWFEEAYQIESMDAFDTVVESIRGAHDDPEFYKQITLTFNPWNEHHWLKREFFDEDTRRKDVFARTTTFRINEWLDDADRARYEDLYRTNPRRARIVADGEWGVSEGLVFRNFSVQDFRKDHIRFHADHIVHGMDFGYTNDPTTIISAAIYEDKKEIYVYYEHYEKSMLTKDIYTRLKYKQVLNELVTADSAEPRLIAELQQMGAKGLRPSVKGKGSIMQGINFLQGYKIILHPSVTHTIEEFNSYVFKQDRSGRWLNEPVDDNNHTIDALRYAVEHLHFKKKHMTTDEKLSAARRLGI